jgi:hypothetical protein
LNRCCVFTSDLESILRAEMLKRLLQHNRDQTGKEMLTLSFSHFDPKPSY